MRFYIIIFVQIVFIKSFNTQDYSDPMDYESGDSDSFSNERSRNHSKSERSNVTENNVYRRAVEPSTLANENEITTETDLNWLKHGHPTRAPRKRENCLENGKCGSNEDKSTTTLINYPFSVSVQKKGSHYASGALIDKRWILSSAGDFFNVRESIKLFRARLGSVDCKKGGTLVPIKRVELHPNYVYGEPNFDLALLRMAQPVDYTDFIRPIGLSKINTKVISAKFMTTYWPRLIVKGKVLPSFAQERIKKNSMRVSTQRLIPKDKCLEMTQNVTLDESTLCLKPFITHHSLCMPDTGAPVIAEDGLWGITSGWTSPNCLLEQSPTMFSRISAGVVRAWLDSQLLTII